MNKEHVKTPMDKRAVELSEEYQSKFTMAGAMVGIEAEMRMLENENKQLKDELTLAEHSLKNAIAEINRLKERVGSY